MTKEDVIRNQLILALVRAYQATSISRAIRLSEQPINPLYLHVDNTQYFSIINDINKFFDKRGDNMITLLEMYKNKIKYTEYEQLLSGIAQIKDIHQVLLEKINNHRNKVSSHIDSSWIVEAVNADTSDKIEIDLNETQELLIRLIELLLTASFIPGKEKSYLKNRIPPKEAQDILKLNIDPKIARDAIKSFFKI